MSTIFIHPTAEVSTTASIGEGTKIWNQAQIREGATIGKNCVIGKDVYIDKGAVIGNGVKIQNGVSIYQGVTLEDDVFVGPYTSFTNDFRPRAFTHDWEIIPTRLCQGSSIGANATILCGVTLGEYSMIGSGAVVTADTLPFGLYVGSPARLSGFVSKDGYEMRLLERSKGTWILECQVTHQKLKIQFNPL